MKLIVPILVIIMVGSLVILSFSASTKDQKGGEWSGKLADGKELSKEGLSRILKEHEKYFEKRFESGGKQEEKADLSWAKLAGVDLRGANLSMAELMWADLRGGNLEGANLMWTNLFKTDLRGANLSGANLDQADLMAANLSAADMRGAFLYSAKLLSADLEGANLSGANLGQADLMAANLSGANLSGADLRGADLRRANLSGAILSKADLTEANLERTNAAFADFSYCIFEPKNVSEFLVLGAKGLSDITFAYPTAAVNLRKVTKEFGFKSEGAALTSALRKFQLKGSPIYVRIFESVVLLGKPTDYGARPWNCVWLLGMLIICCVPIYILALKPRGGRTGIWAVRPTEYLFRDVGKGKPIKVTYKHFFRTLPFGRLDAIKWTISYWFRILRIAFYFSLLSAFQIGWREVNIGNWITRLQSREYTLRANGWVRTVSGVQSLTSIYLLVIWVLSYFVHIFE